MYWCIIWVVRITCLQHACTRLNITDAVERGNRNVFQNGSEILKNARTLTTIVPEQYLKVTDKTFLCLCTVTM